MKYFLFLIKYLKYISNSLKKYLSNVVKYYSNILSHSDCHLNKLLVCLLFTDIRMNATGMQPLDRNTLSFNRNTFLICN